MTPEQEANLWARLVLLERKVAQLEKNLPEQQSAKEGGPFSPEPPRDRYGTAVDRPGM
jgi:hypothetical protein